VKTIQEIRMPGKSSASSCPSLYLALVHFPVLNRKGERIASALTNLDLHDLARLACTYDLPGCFVATPLRDQRDLAERLIGHWRSDIAKTLHPDRERALRRLRLVDSVDAAVAAVERECGAAPLVWATTARESPTSVAPADACKQVMDSGRPGLLLFGTGWGLAPEVLQKCDGVIRPIRGRNGYNHLSVRCAAAILIDRFFAAMDTSS
jgi:hypothetical protein